ncbi:MAG: TIM barrel protein [Bryobacterales bacterium]|nr:TIM barrel protein [Bryobacterales bacterium]
MNLTRREMVTALAAAGGLKAAQYQPILTAQIYVWTQQFNARKQTLAEGMAEAFPAIRRAGYSQVELVSQFFSPELSAKTIALLREQGLKCPVVYSGGAFHEPEAAEKSIGEILKLAETARPAGVRDVNVNPSPKPRQELKTDQELALQARNLDRLAGMLGRHGMRLMTHHHTPELKEKGREWRHQLSHTRRVYTCVDTDWAVRSGEDPLALLRESGRRLLSLHLRSGRSGVWMESLGDGEPDYRPIAAYLKKTGFTGYLVVELAYEKGTQVTRSLEENIRLSREYAERIFDVRA